MPDFVAAIQVLFDFWLGKEFTTEPPQNAEQVRAGSGSDWVNSNYRIFKGSYRDSTRMDRNIL
jgi:hypothetical protein